MATATVGRRQRTGSPATGLAGGGGGGVVGCDFFLFFLSSSLLLQLQASSQERENRQDAGGGATSGGGGGQGHPWLDGRRVEDRVAVAMDTARPLATTAGGRRSGSPLVGRPAGLCQGHPLLSGPPLGPTTFWGLAIDRGHPLGCSRDSGGVCCPSGRKAAERRPAGGGLVGGRRRRRRRRRGGTAVQALPGGVMSVGRHDGSLCDLVLAAVE